MPRTAFVLRDVPGILDVGFGLDDALAMARRTHHRLHYARDADFLDSGLEIFEIVGEAVRTRLDAEFLGGQTADTFAVHGKLGGLCGRDDGKAFLFHLDKRIGRNRLDLGDDVVGLFEFNHTAEFGTVEHVDDVATVGYLHTRGVGVTVHGNHFDSETHHLDDDFLAEFTSSAKQHLGGART